MGSRGNQDERGKRKVSVFVLLISGIDSDVLTHSDREKGPGVVTAGLAYSLADAGPTDGWPKEPKPP